MIDEGSWQQVSIGQKGAAIDMIIITIIFYYLFLKIFEKLFLSLYKFYYRIRSSNVVISDIITLYIDKNHQQVGKSHAVCEKLLFTKLIFKKYSLLSDAFKK